jgi:hypothetical protein
VGVRQMGARPTQQQVTISQVAKVFCTAACTACGKPCAMQATLAQVVQT